MDERERRWERFLELEQRVAALELEAKKPKTPKPKNPGKYTDDELTQARTVLNKINEHAGTSLRFGSGSGFTNHVKCIVNRLRKGATAHEMRLIAWHKCPEMRGEGGVGQGYCKPTTLFIDAHFDDYLDAARLAYDQQQPPEQDDVNEYAETGLEDGSNPMAECHKAIELIKCGMKVHVSDECMREYGVNIKKHRELVAKKQGRGTGSV